ncbi:outer membrane lipid asymmetry maintenance protein MlaD [Glycocaulis profundi]|nr:outer membrane lipid asymmetry maintenance protein MlaD [Glycocaulis profundi]
MRGGALLETIIGLVVLVVAGGFLYFAQGQLDRGPGRDGYELNARFSAIGALARGAEVRVSGVPVGTVTHVTLDTQTYFANIAMNLRGDVPIPADSTAKITSSGILGSPYIEIEVGGDDDMIEPGGEIMFTQGAVDLFDLIGEAMTGRGGNGPAPANDNPSSGDDEDEFGDLPDFDTP